MYLLIASPRSHPLNPVDATQPARSKYIKISTNQVTDAGVTKSLQLIITSRKYEGSNTTTTTKSTRYHASTN